MNQQGMCVMSMSVVEVLSHRERNGVGCGRKVACNVHNARLLFFFFLSWWGRVGVAVLL